MFCQKCDAQLPDNARFCATCGAQFGGAQATGFQSAGQYQQGYQPPVIQAQMSPERRLYSFH